MATTTPADLHAVLVTGVFGSGKTSIAEEIADLLEGAGLPYALLDLDFLMWFHTGPEGETDGDRMMVANLTAVVGNYLAAGVRYLVLAGTVLDGGELDRLKAELRMPLSVVRLTVPLPEIERRFRSHVTTARHRDDLPRGAEQIAASMGAGMRIW